MSQSITPTPIDTTAAALYPPPSPAANAQIRDLTIEFNEPTGTKSSQFTLLPLRGQTPVVKSSKKARTGAMGN